VSRSILVLLALALSATLAAAQATAPAGKYVAQLTCEPTPPQTGDNLFTITVSEGGKPVGGLGVSVHIDMTAMPMPADFVATAGATDGTYAADVNLSMAGKWLVDVKVEQMPGMTMAGDGAARFTVETGGAITGAAAGRKVPWKAILVVVLVLVALVTLIFRRHIPPGTRGVITGLLTLAVVALITVSIVVKYRNPKTATVIGSATMDMSSMQAAPGSVAVSTEVVQPAPFQATVSYTGTVVADSEVDIYPRVAGRLVYMPLYPGDRVTAGQVVARLDTTELSAREAQATYGAEEARQGVGMASAGVAAAQAGRTKAQRAADQAQAQTRQAQSEARGAGAALEAAQGELAGARQMAREAESAITSAQLGIDQADAETAQARAEVESMKADAVYWRAEIAREKTLFEKGVIAREELDRETAQAAASEAKLAQAAAGLRNAEAGVARARQELEQAEARRAAAQAATKTAEARVTQAQADRETAAGKIAEMQAASAASRADVVAAQAMERGAAAQRRMAASAAGRAQAAQGEAATVRGYTQISSPMAGWVSARLVAPGTLVQPGTPVLRVVSTDFVRIQTSISAADAAQVSLGDIVTAQPFDRSSAPIAAAVTAVFPTSDPTARTSVVEARVANRDGRLRPGQYLTVQVGVGQKGGSVLSVPNGALQSRPGGLSLFVVDQAAGRPVARLATVTTGKVSNARTETASGLRAGDEVIVLGLENLEDGAAITVVQRGAYPPTAPSAAQPSVTGGPDHAN
jgi:RND family efflux transporter MFP subunit